MQTPLTTTERGGTVPGSGRTYDGRRQWGAAGMRPPPAATLGRPRPVAVLRACHPGSPLPRRTRTKTARRREQRRKAHAARDGAGRPAQRQAAGWVVDTGASRHVCAPAAAQGRLRPGGGAVETANGTVRAVGEATVFVPGIHAAVDAVVLAQSPCLLSVGLLVQQGYAFWWGPNGCTLRLPRGEDVELKVVGGVPVLEATAAHADGCKTGSGRSGLRAAVAGQGGATRDGVAEAHQQQGHYPWSTECATCNEAALRHAQHRRQLPHAGVLAVDLVSLTTSGPHVLVGATQQPGWAYAEPVRTRSAAGLRDPLLRMVLAAKTRGVVLSVHSDRESGLEALEGALLGLGVSLSTTQGRDPQANGMAEQAAGQLSRMSRAALAHYSPAVARQLWPYAMVWAAQRIADPKLPPFGAKVLARHPPLMPLGKLASRSLGGVFLHRCTRTAGAACVGLLAGGVVQKIVSRRTIRAALTANGLWVFPTLASVQVSQRGRPLGAAAPRARPAPGADAPEGEDAEADAYDMPLTYEDDVPWGDAVGAQRLWGAGKLDDVPFGELRWGDDPTDVAHGPGGAAGGAVGEPPRHPLCGPLRDDGPGQHDRARMPDAKRPLGAAEPHSNDGKRRRGEGPAHPGSDDAGADEEDAAGMDLDIDDLMGGAGAGFVTRLVPPGSPDAQTPEARAAVEKEMRNMLAKGVFDPAQVCD